VIWAAGILQRRRLRPVAILVTVAAIVAVFVGYRISLAPPALHARNQQLGSAHAQVLVDTSNSVIADIEQLTQYQSDLGAQLAINYALYLQGYGPTAALGRSLGLGEHSVAASGPFTLLLGRSNTAQKPPKLPDPRLVDRSYRLLLDVDGSHPLLDIYAQAPTQSAAVKLVDEARGLLERHVATQKASYPPPSTSAAVLRPLGPTVGGTVGVGARWQLMGFAFVLVMLLGWSFMWAQRQRRARSYMAGIAGAKLDRLDELPGCDEWPYTTRLLPWALAGFMAMLFLVPIDAIALPIHLPVNGTLDRPVVVALAMLWFASLAVVSGAARPRLKLGRVHVAVLLFLGVCLVSVAVNGPALGDMNELTLVIKKLALLISYVVFFFIVASVLRPREVPRFAALMVFLGVIVALGTILEYRTHYNVFYTLWGKVLPVTAPNLLDQVDSIGRLTVYGPTLQPLELAAMLAMVLPFAILGAIDAATRRRRMLYAIAVGLLLAGGVATARKTSLVVPVAVILILLAYRPRQVLRLMLKLGLLLGVLVHFVAPAAIGGVISQLEPGHINSALTTTDRTARYDAVAPDVLSHPLLGRGYESYDPQKYRILDNQYLDLLITVGLIGLISYLAIFGAMMLAAHTTIRGPDPRRSSLALGAFATVVAIAIASALFDVLSFPHVPYLLFFVGAMIIALREPSPTPELARLRVTRPVGHAGGPAAGAGLSRPPAPEPVREPVLAG
jgi:O-antigen ligase